MTRTRRRFLQDGGLAAAVLDVPSPWQAALHDTADWSRQVRIDPRPLFAISPLLHMQFMEPLGTTDSSVEAAWDRESDSWREDFVLRARELAPQVLRFGGLFSRYYRWREGIGPARKRPVMRNRVWGGLETNRVGTDELVGLCRSIGAQPLFNVNFLGDGHHAYLTGSDGYRVGGAREAADWVTYCNDPDSIERRQQGSAEPYGVGLWQIGNETSYGAGGFAKDEAIARTTEFAREMRRRDPSIRLIGWGDGDGRELWAGDMVRRAGEQLDFIAVHMMQQLPTEPDTVLRGMLYQREPDRAWEELLALSRRPEARLVELEQELDATGTPLPIAVTEGHLSLTPHNTNPILLEWLSGAYHARMLNLYQRHGDRVRIATVADFNGTRWTTVAVRLQVPRGISYLTPAGSVMRLFGRYNGTEAVSVTATPPELDIAASRSGDRIYLHVANLDGARSIAVEFQVEGRSIAGGRVLAIAPEDLRTAVDQDNPEVFAPTENVLIGTGWRFPKGSVSVVELELR